jgi:hypothetical protein
MIGIRHEEVGVRRNLRRQQRASIRAAKQRRLEQATQRRSEEQTELEKLLLSYSHRLAEGGKQSYISAAGGTFKVELFGLRAYNVLDRAPVRQAYTRTLRKQIKESLAPRSRFTVSLSPGGDDMSDVFATIMIRKLGRIT